MPFTTKSKGSFNAKFTIDLGKRPWLWGSGEGKKTPTFKNVY